MTLYIWSHYELIWPLSSIYGQMRSALDQMREHSAIFFVNLAKSAAQLTKCAHIWPNVVHLVKCRDQLVRCAANLGKCQMSSLVKCALQRHRVFDLFQ